MTECCRIYFSLPESVRLVSGKSRPVNEWPWRIFTEIHLVGFIPRWWDAFYEIQSYLELFTGKRFIFISYLVLLEIICAFIGKIITFLGVE